MTGFSSVFKEYSGFMEIKEAVKENRVPIGVIGTADIHKAFLINGLLEETGKSCYISLLLDVTEKGAIHMISVLCSCV